MPVLYCISIIGPSQVLIDTLVAPTMPIVDMKTEIHGIEATNLNSVQFSLRHAQAFLLKHSCAETILVGHGLSNDLKALRLNHVRIVDTAYLFSIADEPGAYPSLRDISEQRIGVKLPAIHDSIFDSQAALHAATYAALHRDIAPIVRSSAIAKSECSLLVHRIPDFCTVEIIHEMFKSQTSVVPVNISVLAIDTSSSSSKAGEGPTGKVVATFASQRHADLAFESIVGDTKPDKSGRPQKRVYLKNGGYICIRRA